MVMEFVMSFLMCILMKKMGYRISLITIEKAPSFKGLIWVSSVRYAESVFQEACSLLSDISCFSSAALNTDSSNRISRTESFAGMRIRPFSISGFEMEMRGRVMPPFTQVRQYSSVRTICFSTRLRFVRIC